MEVLDGLGPTLHTTAALVAVLLVGRSGRALAARMGQPPVIGEITVGLLAGPAVIALLGRKRYEVILPDPVFQLLSLLGEMALVLFLAGLVHKLRGGAEGPSRRSTAWVAAGAMVLPVLCGLALAGWVLLTDDAAARGDAPLPAFLLMLAVAMSITAVPVMARLLADRGMSESAAGASALAAAIVIDGAGWMLFSLAMSLGADDFSGSLHSAGALAAGGACALAIRFGLRLRTARRWCERLPAAMAVLLGAATLGTALLVGHLGMSTVVGAALVGLSIPGGPHEPWARPLSRVAGAGRVLLPAFFVVTGVSVFDGSASSASWGLIALAVLLGTLGKLLGGYAGARLGGHPPFGAGRIAVLLNTRGLTELIILEAGHSAGILTAPMVLALLVMALVTTAMTGPLLNLVDRSQARPVAETSPRETEGSRR